ncbi:MAG: hypothetical protein ACOY0T_28745 [Myxococcota bacterium]
MNRVADDSTLSSVASDDKATREHLERRANLLRNRFLRRLDTLDRRGHELVNVASELRAQTKRALPLALGIAGAAVIVGAVVYINAERRRRRSPQYFLERWLGEPPRENSALRGAIKGAARALAVKALQAVARRAIERLGEASEPEPQALGART